MQPCSFPIVALIEAWESPEAEFKPFCLIVLYFRYSMEEITERHKHQIKIFDAFLTFGATLRNTYIL